MHMVVDLSFPPVHSKNLHTRMDEVPSVREDESVDAADASCEAFDEEEGWGEEGEGEVQDFLLPRVYENEEGREG